MLAMIEKLKEFFVDREDVKFAVIYGSAATNHLTEYSDVDIAVAADKELTDEQLDDLYEALADICGRDIDLVDINTACNALVQEILNKGVVLLNDPDIHAKLTKLIWYDESVIGHDSRNHPRPKRRRQEFE